jgi:multiple antibiotic resistance protein
MILEIGLTAFAALFATIGPLDVAIVFASLTGDQPARTRLSQALKGTAIAAMILFGFALFGEAALALFGITLPALQISGGVLLLLIAIDMVFARPSGGTSTTAEETAEAAAKADISVFPLATPLIAGPGAMGGIVLLMAEAEGDAGHAAIVLGALAGVLILTLGLMLVAGEVQRLMGRTGVHVVARIFGVLLAALAVQFMLDGLANSGLLRAVAGHA